ncbi:ParB/RepB/Spo0J family partition protein [Brevundimonas nasdae]|uniref:ParB/RepB/Spo0J family partition protein n=1 Tax=Brevundimonas nasdae TaxID=172043 RepID=UPI003F68EC19
MNVPLTLPHGLSNAALNGEDLLRVLSDRPMGSPFASQTEIAKATNRAPKNIGRDLSQLEAAKLIRAPGVDHGEWSAAALTDAGWDALSALDRAAGMADGGGLIFWSPGLLDDNPLNPRKTYDADSLATLADTIEADGQIIEPLSVSPVRANGRRVVWAGHRRKRAALIVEARFAARGEALPPGLVRGVPCVERDATPAESLFIAVVENSQRENLPPWEDAQALAALASETGWSGRELARRTGRAPKLDQGDEEGVRDVQEKIKVVKTAPPELVEAHEAGAITWEQLRSATRNGRLPTQTPTASKPEGAAPAEDQVFGHATGEPAPDPEPAPEPTLELDFVQRLTLLEILKAGLTSSDRLVVGEGPDQVVYVPTGKYWLDLVASTLQTLRLISFKHQGQPYVALTPAGFRWIKESFGLSAWEGERHLFMSDLIRALAETYANVTGDATAWQGPGYVTDWLNPPDQPEPAAQPIPAATMDDAAQVDVEDAVAAQLLTDARALVDIDEPGSTSVRNILARAGLCGPFTASDADPGVVVDGDGATTLVTDVDNQLTDDVAKARALVMAAALNRFCAIDPKEVL